jgi:hypothetical protein
MVDVVSYVLAALDRLKQGAPSLDAQPQPLMKTFDAIREKLDELGLFGQDSLVLLSGGDNRIILDAKGELVSSPLFKNITAPYAVFSSGPHTRKFAQRGTSLKASCDDMAQLFGYSVPCVRIPRGPAGEYLIKDKGFLVTGRFESEVVAAAILVEKACRTELLAPKLGKLHYLNPALCKAEHAVYLASYSRHEKEANSGLR